MDMKIEDGDFAVDDYGQSVEINGDAVLLQSVRLALSLPLGAVLSRPALGSMLTAMQNADETALEQEILRVTENFPITFKSMSRDETAVHIVLEHNGQTETIDISLESEAE